MQIQDDSLTSNTLSHTRPTTTVPSSTTRYERALKMNFRHVHRRRLQRFVRRSHHPSYLFRVAMDLTDGVCCRHVR